MARVCVWRRHLLTADQAWVRGHHLEPARGLDRKKEECVINYKAYSDNEHQTVLQDYTPIHPSTDGRTNTPRARNGRNESSLLDGTGNITTPQKELTRRSSGKAICKTCRTASNHGRHPLPPTPGAPLRNSETHTASVCFTFLTCPSGVGEEEVRLVPLVREGCLACHGVPVEGKGRNEPAKVKTGNHETLL